MTLAQVASFAEAAVRYRLAEALWEMEARDEAVEHFRELLRLNPNDAQGATLPARERAPDPRPGR